MRRRTSDKSARERALAVTGEAPQEPAPQPQAPKRPPSISQTATEPRDRKQGGSGAKGRRAASVHMEGFENIVDNLFIFDVDATYKELVAFLERIKPSRLEYGSLVDTLDEAAGMVERAHLLAANAKVALARFEVDQGVIKGELREQAYAELLDQRDGKKPTIADVEAYMAANYHDEVSSQREQTAKAKESCNYFDGLAKALQERQRDLRQMVASSRGG